MLVAQMIIERIIAQTVDGARAANIERSTDCLRSRASISHGVAAPDG